jgi:hypothetical protein
MKLSDVMSAAGLAGYAEVSLILFLAVFVTVIVQILSKRSAAEWERAASLPLLDGTDADATSAPQPENP